MLHRWQKNDDDGQNASHMSKKEASIDCFCGLKVKNPNENTEGTLKTDEEEMDMDGESAGTRSDSQINRRE